jgi:hypothetical protein
LAVYFWGLHNLLLDKPNKEAEGQSFSWRVQNRTLKDSGENRTVRHVVL